MAHIISDRVADTSTTTGTSDFTAANAPPTGFETLDTVLATSDTFDYLIAHQTLNEWEVGIGTYSGSHVFVRTTVKQSSNSDAAVNFSAGSKDVFIAHSADRIKNPRIASVNEGPLAGFRNHLLNGAMMVAQRGTSFTSTTTPANNDDTYLLDRWILLSDGNDIVDVTQSTEAPAGGLYSIGLDVETANKKFGILQVIEQKNCIGLIGNTVTLSFKAKVSATTNLDNLKAAIISWDGTADTVTSDIISAWNVEGTNPTLVANWTYENTPANLSPTTSFATYSVSAAVDTASTKNIGVFIWSDVTTTSVGSVDILYITSAQIEVGSTATPFERRPFGIEREMCQRYYHKTFLPAVAPAQNAGFEGVHASFGHASGNIITTLRYTFPVTMRTTPVVTYYNPGAANANWSTGGVAAASSVSVPVSPVSVYPTATAPTITAGAFTSVHLTADAEL